LISKPSEICHVMDRGDRREDIFVIDVGRQDLLKTLAETCQKTAWRAHAYCLMRNHSHLVLETPNANLEEGMRWFLSAYTIRLNHRQKLFGHVFSGPHKALIVEGCGNEGLSRRGWRKCDLAMRRRNDPGKLAIAARLRSETPLPVKWTAARVQIGTTKGAKSLLQHLAHGPNRNKPARANEPSAQLEFQSPV
jgi:REP element-mobilizing transposase RayT